MVTTTPTPSAVQSALDWSTPATKAGSTSLSTPTLAPLQNTTTVTPDNTALTPGQFNNQTTTPPVSKPTAVVSSSPATKVATQAKTIVSNPPTVQPSGYNDVRDANGLLVNPPGAAFDRNTGKPITTSTTPPLTPPPTSTTTTPTSTPGNPTPEDTITHDGQTQFYNTTSGQPQWINNSQVTNGQPPTGFSTTNPQTVAVTSSVQDNNNNTLNQYADGHYGLVDSAGNYVNITAQTYNNAKAVSTAQTALNNLQNGIMTPDQQTQLNNITQQFQTLIDQQQKDNANATGGATLAQNMYGIGNTSIGAGAITQVINDGAAKISDLQAKESAAISDMKQSFITNDTNLLKTAYENYNNAVNSVKDEINNMQTQIQNAKTKQDNAYQAYALQQTGKYGDAGILPTDTPQQVDAKKQQSAIYKQELATKVGTVDQDVLDGMLKIYNKTGAIPAGMGNASVELKKAFYAAIGGAPALADAATANKAALGAATKALATQQNQYAATQTSTETLKKSIDLVSKYDNKLDKTGVPIFNQYLQWLQGKVAGNTDITSLNAALTTTATEYAKIMSGASASIAGVTVSSADDVKNLLNSAMSKGQIDGVLDIMKQDSNFRLTSQKGTIDQINKDISELGNTPTTNTSDTSVKTNTDGTLQSVSF